MCVSLCRSCGTEFQPKTSGGRYKGWYCSRACSHRAHSHKAEVPCSQCAKPILRKRYHREMSGRRGHFCDHQCYARWQSEHMRGEQNPSWKERVVLECQWCAKAFALPPHAAKDRVFCSNDCRDAAHRKDYPQAESFYNALWQRQRGLALARDDHQCVHCQSPADLLVHHKTPLRELLAEAVRRAHELDNLETTCEACHGHQHSRLLRSRTSSR